MRKKWKGSLTLEAALVLPIFLFFSLNIASIVYFFQGDSERIAKQTEIAKNAAVLSYSLEGGRNPSIADRLGLGRTEHNVFADDNVDIYSLYAQKPWFADIGYRPFYTLDRATCRKWTGYDPTNRQNGGRCENEEMVYVVEHSEVYHKDPNCFHIDIRVHEVTEREIQKNGYIICESCEKRNGCGTYYKTNSSEIYHTSLACNKIKRSISVITLKQAEENDLPPCGDCGR